MMTQYAGNGLLHLLVSNHLALLGLDAADVDGATVSEGHTCGTIGALMMMTSCATYEPLQFHIVEGLEEVLVVNLKLTSLQIHILYPDVLIVVAHLIGMGIQPAVWGDDTVAVEVIVAGGILAVVATVCEYLATRDGALVAHTLIHEVPDIAALILRILAHQIPIFLEATHRVAHGVSIFTLDQRTRIIVLRISLAALVAVVHGTEDVGLAVLTSLLKLAGTSLVGSLHPVVGLFKVRTIAGLIAQTPHDDRGMVFEGMYVAILTLQMSLLEVGALSQRMLAIAHAVALKVRLGSEIDTILVAEVIPAGIIRIVAGAHGIDVQLLHDLDVLDHALYRDDITTVGIELMTVGTFY